MLRTAASLLDVFHCQPEVVHSTNIKGHHFLLMMSSLCEAGFGVVATIVVEQEMVGGWGGAV